MAQKDKDVLARMLGVLSPEQDPIERRMRLEGVPSFDVSREPAGVAQEQTPTIVKKYGGAPAKEAQSLINEAMSITRSSGIKGSENLKKVEETLSESLEGRQPDPKTADDARSFFESRINKLNKDKATKLLDMDQKLEAGLEQLRQAPKSDMSMGELLGRSLFALAPLLARAGGEYAGALGGQASVKMAEDFAKDIKEEGKRQKELEGQKVKLGYERGKKEVEEMDALLKKLQEGEIDLELLPLKQKYLLQELALRSGATMAGRQDETADTLLKGAGLMAKLAELQALRPREGAGAGGKEPAEKKPTASMYQAGGFALTARQAEEALDKLIAKGYDPTSFSSSTQREVSGGILRGLTSSDAQIARNAEKQWITAVVRDESGAAVKESEWQRYADMYFPRMGDSPEVLQQKKQMREAKLAKFEAEAGEKVMSELYASGITKAAVPAAVKLTKEVYDKFTAAEAKEYMSATQARKNELIKQAQGRK
jgi:DNA-directed RNA polymerase subunit F